MLLSAATFKVPCRSASRGVRISGLVLMKRLFESVFFFLIIAPSFLHYWAWGRVVLIEWEYCFWYRDCL